MNDVLYYLKHKVETVVRCIAGRMLVPIFLNRLLAVLTSFIYYIFLSTCPVNGHEHKSNFKSPRSMFEKTNA